MRLRLTNCLIAAAESLEKNLLRLQSAAVDSSERRAPLARLLCADLTKRRAHASRVSATAEVIEPPTLAIEGIFDTVKTLVLICGLEQSCPGPFKLLKVVPGSRVSYPLQLNRDTAGPCRDEIP